MDNIKLRYFWISGCITLLACGTVNRIARNVDSATSSSGYVAGQGTAAGTGQSIDVGRAANEDEQWIQTDDYFIADQEYRQGWISVHLAKMTAAPTSTTKNEAQFFRLDQSKDFWTTNYWKTRVASSADLQIGTLLICFQGNGHDGVYQAPRDKQNARTNTWFMGRLTDTRISTRARS